MMDATLEEIRQNLNDRLDWLRNNPMPGYEDWCDQVMFSLADLTELLTRLAPLEAAATPATATASENSSALSLGHALKPLEWQLASQVCEAMLSAVTPAITAFFKSIGYTSPALEANWLDSSTLQLTLRWPTNSGSILDGFPGHVNHEIDDLGIAMKASQDAFNKVWPSPDPARYIGVRESRQAGE